MIAPINQSNGVYMITNGVHDNSTNQLELVTKENIIIALYSRGY